ncbi:Zinc finger protein ZAT4 [Frankliniella fusca]|uniref:Zinc finger protein ZAT4 n=1 Tax=Frankliniella fusca TaxID=407009 RepID=A0AAE1LPI7_9NEOP|nr:Zinc finger protein ZAT4 [Frankliniella fusca]
MDSSFFSDENGNRCPFQPPNATSTPRKKHPKLDNKSAKYLCPHCSKPYQVKFYYDKHVLSHNSQVTTSDLDVSRAVQIDCSDLSLRNFGGDTSVTSTPSVFKQPTAPVQAAKKKVVNVKQKKKEELICTYCLKKYVCSKSFKMHMRAHYIQSAAARVPNADQILENTEEFSDKAMLVVANSPSYGDSGAKFRQLVGHIASISASEEWKDFCHGFCSELVDSIRDKNCILPSSLATTLIDRLNSTLTNVKFNDLIKILKLGDLFDGDVLAQFFLEFGLNLMTEVFRYLCSTFRKCFTRNRQAGEPQVNISKEDRQVVYYIGGSIMRGFLKISKRSGKSATWKKVAEVLKANILIDKPSGDIESDSEWTKSVDRGSLLYISPQCQEFFIKLTQLVFSKEKRNGSIDYESVISTVSKSDLSVEWDSIISDSLDETVSFNLLNEVVLCFCRTCGRGFAKRRLNATRKKFLVSMPTRHLVASRKK